MDNCGGIVKIIQDILFLFFTSEMEGEPETSSWCQTSWTFFDLNLDCFIQGPEYEEYSDYLKSRMNVYLCCVILEVCHVRSFRIALLNGQNGGTKAGKQLVMMIERTRVRGTPML